MKIAVLSDIHGNIAALTAVLAQVKKSGISKIWVLGDMMGYYYYHNEVFTELSLWDHSIIAGNHEKIFLEYIKNDKDFCSKIDSKYGNSFKLASQNMSSDLIERIEHLPENLVEPIKGKKYMLCHGSPWNINEYIYPDSPANVFNKFADFEEDFIFMGHTHYPFFFAVNGKQIINVGSVGQSRIYGGIANWGIVDIDNNTFSPRATNYERSELIKSIKKNDLGNKYLTEILYRNNA
jgi:putative phosphoesterase